MTKAKNTNWVAEVLHEAVTEMEAAGVDADTIVRSLVRRAAITAWFSGNGDVHSFALLVRGLVKSEFDRLDDEIRAMGGDPAEVHA